MAEKVTDLGTRAAADVYVEKGSPPPIRAIAFWKALDAEKRRWARILANIGTGVTDDQEVLWTPAFIQEYERVQRSFWQRLRGIELEGTLHGPQDGEYKATGNRRDITLFWTPKAEQAAESVAQKRIAAAQPQIFFLGNSLVAIEGGMPVRRSFNLHQQYGPPVEKFVPETETRQAFHQGMDYILGQVFDAQRSDEHPSSPLLRNLKTFRKDHARWAVIQGRGIVALEPGKKDDAWMAVVPESSEILQEQKHTILVNREPGGIKLMRVLPLGFTREWAGLVGVHELEHLENAYTGKEPEHANREEYIEGEVRAYTVEIGAANILSRDRFTQAIDAMIDVFGWRTYTDILSMRSSKMSLVLANNLDAYITPDAPKSQAEAGLRLGLYIIATGFRLSEREANGDHAKELQLKRELIAVMYGEGGAGLI